MTTVMINNTNPVLEFYSKLLYLLKESGYFDKRLAEDLVQLSDKSEHISLGVDVECLEEWHGWIENQSDEEYQMTEDITVQCFADLASQMRTESARDLFQSWVAAAHVENDLFVCIRKKKELGDGAGSVTIVTNNLDRYQTHCFSPEDVLRSGKVHYTL